MATRAEKNQKAAEVRAQEAAQDKKKGKSRLRGGGAEGSGAVHVPKAVEDKAVVNPRKMTSGQLPQIRSAKDVAADNAGRAEEAGHFGEWMGATLPKLDEYRAADSATQAEMREEVMVAEEYLQGILKHQDKLVRREAWLALFRYRLGQTFTSHEDCMAMFDDMVSQECLIPTVKPDDNASLPGGLNDGGQPMTIYGKTYNFPVHVPFAEKDVTEMQQLAKDLRVRTMNTVKQDRQSRHAEFPGRATISIEEAHSFKPGLVHIFVPSGEEEDKDQPGKKKYLQGGDLLLKSDGEFLYVEDVVNEVGYGSIGVFERNILAMMDMKSPPKIRIDKVFEAALDTSKPLRNRKIYLPSNLPRDLILAGARLGRMIIRGIDAHYHPDTLKQELLKEAEKVTEPVGEGTAQTDSSQTAVPAQS